MSESDEIKNKFAEQLEKRKQAHAVRLESDLQSLRANLLREFRASLPPDLGRQVGRVAANFSSRPAPFPVHPLVDITSASPFQELDNAFITSFELARHYPIDKLRSHRTTYCDTLEEYFDPILGMLDVSSEQRQAEKQRLVAEAQKQAADGEKELGCNISGKGAYINGWIFAYKQDFSAKEAINRPETRPHILATAIHEKLGHGFLGEYSVLGELMNHLGLTQMELARRFRLQTADDPTATMRRLQHNLLFRASHLLQEGWATWVETYLASSLFGFGSHPRANLNKVVEAINNLPPDLPGLEEIQQKLLVAIWVLFGDKDVPLEVLGQVIENNLDIKPQVDNLLKLGQPLVYVLGELLLCQAEANLGPLCVPYAALIANGVKFDPAQVGPTDMEAILRLDPRMLPNVRMAAISRLQLATRNDVALMVKSVAAQLSFSIPKELQGR